MSEKKKKAGNKKHTRFVMLMMMGASKNERAQSSFFFIYKKRTRICVREREREKKVFDIFQCYTVEAVCWLKGKKKKNIANYVPHADIE